MVRMIPPEIIDEIIARTDIVELIGQYVPLKKRGHHYFGLCPFHNEDTESFAVNPEKQFYNCFGCGKGGNVISFVRDMESLSFTEAAKKLADRAGIALPEEALSAAAQQKLDERRQLFRLHEQTRDFYRQLLWAGETNAGQAYLRKRGVSRELAEHFGLGYAPESEWQALYDHLNGKNSGEMLEKAGLVSKSAKNGRYYDKFHGRLIFPIADYQGRVIAFGGRTLTNEPAKYLNSMNTPLFNKSQQLYGLDLAASTIRSTNMVFIMEGYMDVIAAHQYGVTNAVATLGTAFTEEHGRLLKRYAPELPNKLTVYLAFDGDRAGAKAALGGLTKLRQLEYIQVRILVLPEGDDPDDFLRREGAPGWQELVKQSSYPILDYLLRLALQRHDTENASGKSEVVEELLPAIAATKSGVEREGFIRELARQLQVNEESVYADLRRSGLKIAKPGGGAVNPAALKTTVLKRPEVFLLRLALEDKNIFALAKRELGEDFPANAQEAQLISLIENLGEEYDYHPATLFNHIEPNSEGLRQFLLKLLQADIPQGDKGKLAGEWINGVKRALLQGRKAELQQRLTQAIAAGGEVRELLAEKMLLDKQFEELKG